MSSKVKKQMAAISAYMPETSIELTEDDLPEIKGWKIGETHKITVKATVKSLREQSDMMPMPESGKEKEAAKKICARLKITDAKLT